MHNKDVMKQQCREDSLSPCTAVLEGLHSLDLDRPAFLSEPLTYVIISEKKSVSHFLKKHYLI